MIFESTKPIRKYELTRIFNNLKNPTITSVVCYSDRDRKSVETMTKLHLQKKKPFTVFFVREG
jgi:hypothetical protein